MTGWWMGLGRGLALAALAAGAGLAALAGLPPARPPPDPAGPGARPALFALRSPGMPTLRRALDYRALFLDETSQTVVGDGREPGPGVATRRSGRSSRGRWPGRWRAWSSRTALCPMRPRLDLGPRGGAGEIAHLGRQVFVNTLVMALWLNLDRLLGPAVRLARPRSGFYAVAWNLAAVAEGLVTRACDVYFSMLARRAGPRRPGRLARAVCRARGRSGGCRLMAAGGRSPRRR